METAASLAPQVSIIVPTLNEAENLTELTARIGRAMAGTPYEIIIVDDNSTDRTREVCAALGRDSPLRLLVREQPKNGLSGAVLEGMAAARGEYLCVMDADLQHPPEKLPELLAPLRTGEADFVIGSRYMPGGSTDVEWSFFRKINSRVATFLARPFAGRTSDPMAGFFALKRQTYQSATQLTPLGYKIALELMCKTRARSVKEIPIHFGMRLRGESKLSLKQQFRYLEHLSRLYDFTFPRASPAIKFLITLVASWFIGFGTFILLARAGYGWVAAPTIAYLMAICVTAVFHIRYVRTQREFIIRRWPWLDFLVISLAELIACATTAFWVSQRVDHPGAYERFILPFGVATVVRYVLRKEFLQDIRGLRRLGPREMEMLSAIELPPASFDTRANVPPERTSQ